MKDEQKNSLLEALEKNAKAKPAELAAMTGASESEVEKEIELFSKKGLIKRFKAVIDWDKAGKEVVYAIIEVKIAPQRVHGYDSVAQRIANFPEVRTSYLVSGAYDLLAVVEGKSLKEVSNFVSQKLAAIEGVQSTNTHFLLKKYKEEGESFFEEGSDKRLAVTA